MSMVDNNSSLPRDSDGEYDAEDTNSYEGMIEDFSIDQIQNEMRKEELIALREQYQIPGCVGMRLPERGEKPSRPPKGHVLVHPLFVQHGFSLPLHPYIQKILSSLGLAPMQLNPSVYRMMIAMYILWKQNSLDEPTFEQFRNQVDLKIHPHAIGWWYQSPYPGVGRLISGKSITDSWKNKFFFAFGDWEFGERDPPSQARVETRYQLRDRFPRPEHPPDISEEELLEIEFIKPATVSDRSKQALLTPSNLIKYQFIFPWLGGMDGGKKRNRAQESLLKALERGAGSSNNVDTNHSNGGVRTTSSTVHGAALSNVEAGARKIARTDDSTTIHVHPMVAPFIRAVSSGIMEPEKNRQTKCSPKEMMESSFAATIEAAILQYSTHQGLVTELEKKQHTIVELRKKMADLRNAYEDVKKESQDVHTRTQEELAATKQEVEALRARVNRLPTDPSEYAQRIDEAREKGFFKCLDIIREFYEGRLDLSDLTNALRNGEVVVRDDSDHECEGDPVEINGVDPL